MKQGMALLHGIGGCGETWRGQIEHFKDRYEMLAWNAPGFGGAPPLSDLSFANVAARLADDLQEAGITKAVVVGHSFGGMVAQQFVKDFPERVSALVLVGTSPAFGNPGGDFQKQFVADRTRPLDEGRSMEQLAREGLPNLMGPRASTSASETVCQSMAQVPEQTYRDVVQLLTTFDLRKALADISVPVLLVAGENDKLSPPQMMERTAGYIPNARFEMLPGIGHMTHIEDPEGFNALLDNFLGDNFDV